MNCLLTSPASDLAIAGPAGVMLSSEIFYIVLTKKYRDILALLDIK